MDENINNKTAEELEIEEELRQHKEMQEKHEQLVRKFDFPTALVIIGIALFFVIGGLKMPVESLTGDPSKWYLGPGFMPVLCGTVLILLSLLLIVKAFRAGVKITAEDREKAMAYIKSQTFIRLIVAGAFLVIYLFGMLRRLDYFVATFIYMSVNMIFFTSKPRNVKNVLFYILISGVAAGLITFGFGTLAQIPLP